MFGKKEREVTQSLAIANLMPRIRDLYRDEQVDVSDLQLLTMATKTQQREWLKLWDNNDAPIHSDLKHWLLCRDRHNPIFAVHRKSQKSARPGPRPRTMTAIISP